MHLEEDAAKAMHEGFPDSAEKTYIDYNRCGTPLIEIVSEPDLRTSAEAYAYLTTLKQVLLYTGVSDCNMEEGSLRCDANVSVRRRGSDAFGTKVEVKNLNSFRYLARALEYEIERHIGILESGGRLEQETRLWNQAAGRTDSMRTKERAHDYRYFPEPDLLPVSVAPAWREEIARTMPELPAAKRDRLVRDYGITPSDAGVLTATSELASYFESVVRAGGPPKLTANWMQTELLRRLNDASKEINESLVAPDALADLLMRVESNQISAAIAKVVFLEMFNTGRSASEIVVEKGLRQITGPEEIDKYLLLSLLENYRQLEQIHGGKITTKKFFLGDVMKRTQRQANAVTIEEQLDRILDTYEAAKRTIDTRVDASPDDPVRVFITLYPEMWQISLSTGTSSSLISENKYAEPGTAPTTTGE